MDNKIKIGGLLLIILILAILIMGSGGNNSSSSPENQNVTINGITFTAPVTTNNTTTEYKTPTGGTTWAYEDYDNNVSVYVCTERDYNYELEEQWDELSGYSQMRPVGDYWFIVCADRSSDKDLIYKSAHMD